MKKLLAILLSVVMVMCLFAACDSDSDGDDDDDKKGGASSSYETPVDRALKLTICKGTKADMKAMYPEEYWDVNDFDEAYETFSSSLETRKEQMEEQIGENVKYTYEITDKEEIKGDDLDEIKEYLAEEYGIDEDDVEKAYSLDFEFTIKGSEDKIEQSTEDAEVVCIRGEWYQYPF